MDTLSNGASSTVAREARNGETWDMLPRQYQKTHDPTPPHHPQNQKTIFRNMFGGFGGLERTRENHTSRSVRVLNYLVTEKARKPTQIVFLVSSTSNSSPVLLFRHLSFLNTKRRAPENNRDLSCQKLIWSHGVPLCEKSDAYFCC